MTRNGDGCRRGSDSLPVVLVLFWDHHLLLSNTGQVRWLFDNHHDLALGVEGGSGAFKHHTIPQDAECDSVVPAFVVLGEAAMVYNPQDIGSRAGALR